MQAANWVWNPVDFCETWPDCEFSDSHMIGTVHYDENLIEFKIVSLPLENNVLLASDESVTYTIVAKRPYEGNLLPMKRLNYYSGKVVGKSENMLLEAGQIVRLKPDAQGAYIEQYKQWRLLRVVQKGSEIIEETHLLDITVNYSELSANK